MITQEEVNDLFILRSNGELFWKKDYYKGKKNTLAGYDNGEGYKVIKIKGKMYLLHHIVWLMVYGYLPKEIDHVNHNRSDNRIDNLREVEHKENCRNKTLNKNNTSGVEGVYWLAQYNVWQARIRVNGKHVSLGCYKDFNEAVKARKEGERKYKFHKNHGSNLC